MRLVAASRGGFFLGFLLEISHRSGRCGLLVGVGFVGTGKGRSVGHSSAVPRTRRESAAETCHGHMTVTSDAVRRRRGESAVARRWAALSAGARPGVAPASSVHCLTRNAGEAGTPLHCQAAPTRVGARAAPPYSVRRGGAASVCDTSIVVGLDDDAADFAATTLSPSSSSSADEAEARELGEDLVLFFLDVV